MHVTALIMAGGSGARFQADTPKQLALLAGRPMVAWSTAVLAAAPRVDSIVIVTSEGVDPSSPHLLPADSARKLRAVVTGGTTRQESVFNGLRKLPADATHVLIHDAARPCASEALVGRVLDALASHDAVVPVIPATDTLVRQVDGTVDALVDRTHVARVQTPQGFRVETIVRAHREASARGFNSSDDGSLVLALGLPVATVAGERSNLKVTFAEDARLAEAILAGRTR